MKKKYALLILIILMTGCAYYNTFYNAEKYFKDAQEMELRDNGKPSPSAIQKYNKVIKKCGIVITDYPKSDYADDAVMLLAKTFFYKGTNYGQAAEKFNDILTYYPNSEFVPDTHLFLARISYQLKKKEEAYSKLREFIQNPEFEDHHPKALIILANYHLQDKKLAEADFYFNQVITNYPQSKEYETAFFARGKTFYLAEKYDDSNKVFYDLLKSRVGKQIKLDSRYYIALNFLLTEQYGKAENEAKKLIKSESRLVEISKIELLLARAKAGNEQVDEAIGLCENIIQNNKGSFLAAETSYYLAEFYFNYKKNYEKAIEYYNNVKKERKKSPFVKEALGKSVVAAQIIQYYQPDSEISQDELVLQQFNLAEHYVNTLEMPDSAIVVYNNIILDKQKFELQLDSLEISKVSLAKILADSLIVLDSLKLSMPFDSLITSQDSTDIITPEKAEFDTLEISKIALSKILADSLIVLDSLKLSMPFDSLITSQDSTDIITLEKVEFDTLEITTVATEKDSVVSINYATVDSTEYLSVIEKIKRTKQVIKSYENEFIPYSRFVKLWLYQNVTIDSIKAEIEFEKLLELGDNNKYGYAAKRLGSGEKVELTTFTEQLQKSEYEHALEDLATDPAKTLELLEPIISDSLHIFQEKAIYSNAYINYLILSDSVAAKPFVEAILENEESGYILEIKKFYDKGKFLKFDRLPYLEQLERKEEQAKAEAAEQVSQDESEALERDRKAKVLGGSTIKWPIIREASAANVIIVQVEIDEKGNVGNIEVIQSLIEAKPSLDNIVIAQIKNWKFASALKDGEKVKSILELSFTYDLEKR